MKALIRSAANSASVLFLLFCLLIAGRDAFSGLILAEESVSPVSMLVVYLTSASVFAWLFRFVRTGSPAFLSPFLRLERKQRTTFVKLGVATWIVYAVTIFGIEQLGAPIFNVIDYGGMPVFTLLAATTMLGDRITRRQVLGAVVATVGVLAFLIATNPTGDNTPSQWRAWVGLALLSPVFTALCSGYQKQHVSAGLHADEVLLYRFPIPAFLMLIWWIVARPEFPLARLPVLLLIALFGVFAPLWLLCQGFVRASLARFSAYLFLIPLFTLALGSLVIPHCAEQLKNPTIIAGTILVLAGYLIFEDVLRLRRRKPPLGQWGHDGGLAGQQSVDGH